MSPLLLMGLGMFNPPTFGAYTLRHPIDSVEQGALTPVRRFMEPVAQNTFRPVDPAHIEPVRPGRFV